MKKHIVPAMAVATVLAFGAWAPLFAEEEDEQVIRISDVPAAVQKTFNDEAAGGKIVRVEKEESNYEAVIEKDGKQTGVEVSADGKVVSRHNESKEHKEKGEKGYRCCLQRQRYALSPHDYETNYYNRTCLDRLGLRVCRS